MSRKEKRKSRGPREAGDGVRQTLVKSPAGEPPAPRDTSALAISAATVCLVLAAAVALYLVWVSVTGGSVAGCGPGSNCDQVLQSRWSKWFGLPVSAFSLLIYGALLAASRGLRGDATDAQRQRARQLILPATILVLGAALWFAVLQFGVIKAICPYCMTAHALGSIAALLLLGTLMRNPAVRLDRSTAFGLAGIAVALLAVLVGGQLVYEPPSHIERPVAALLSNAPSASPAAAAAQSPRATQIPDVPATPIAATQSATAATVSPAAIATTNQPALVAPPATNRVFAIYNGQFKFHLDEVPLIGSPTAPHVMVSLFDYTCHHCRTMHERLLAAHATWPTELAIITLPMPLDPQCNTTMTRTHPDHVNACFYGRLGLAVVRADRSKSAQFDEFIFTPERPPATNDALAFAQALVGTEPLARAQADPWVENLLRQSVAIYELSYRAGQGSMPQSIIGNRIAVGLLRPEDLNRLLGEQFGLKPPAP